ncbi:MAG: hypothetical protein LBM68_03645 [Bacteroidales bacterium]|jgi:hypothetical protein|nr:hypothetical protein [Bacteroidales bacterium]
MNNHSSKTTISDYIDNSELNARIYQILLHLQDCNQPGIVKLKRHPLEIFNQAYAICEELQQEKYPEEAVIPIWKRLRNSFILHEVNVIFSCVYVIQCFSENKNPNMRYFLFRVKDKIDTHYFKKFEPLLSEELTYITALPANFEFLKTEADTISDLDKRELFYADYLTRYKQAKNKGNILQQIFDEIDLIQRTKALTTTEEQKAETTEKSGTKRTLKVTTDVLMLLLEKSGISAISDDKTKMARLIAYLTDFSEEKIRQRLSNTEELTSYHREEVETINKILAELNSNISIKYNKQR